MENNNNPMEVNNASTQEQIKESCQNDTQQRIEKEDTSAGVKGENTTGGENTTRKVIVEGAKVVTKVAEKGVKTGVGLFGFIASHAKMLLIIACVTGAVAAGLAVGMKYIIDDNKIKIMDTATVVTEIRKISELTTYTYVDELIIQRSKTEVKDAKLALLGLRKKDVVPDSIRSEIVIITSGITRAGYDLGKISEGDLKISGDTVSVKLPAAEIFDIIVNPSNNKIFEEEGKWSHEEITEMQVNCRNQMLQNAIDRGILVKADELGQKKVENLFKVLGFKEVTIIPSSDSSSN